MTILLLVLLLTGKTIVDKANLDSVIPQLNGGNQNSDSTVKWEELSNMESTMPNGVNERKPVGYNQWN